MNRREFVFSAAAAAAFSLVRPAFAAVAKPVPRQDYRGPSVVLIRFGGGVRRRETIDPMASCSRYLLDELVPRGVLFPQMEIAAMEGLATSHGEGTLNLLTGKYDRYRDVESAPLRARFEAKVPTLFEHLRATFAIAPHETLIVNGEDRLDEEFYTFSSHAEFGAEYRAQCLSLYRFKRHLLRRQLAGGDLAGGDWRKKEAQLRGHREGRARGSRGAAGRRRAHARGANGDSHAPRGRRAAFRGVRMRWLASRAHRVVVALLLSQSLVLSFVVVGWTYRLMRRAVVRAWWQRNKPGSYEAFAAGSEGTRTLARWPCWFREEREDSRGRRLGALRDNLRCGFAGMLTTWSLTLPACGLWLAGWHFGWDNSFHKGYEQHAEGRLAGWLGIALFVAAMLYVPLAQARQAVTGDWQRFFDVRLVLRLAASRWPALAGLAILYAGVSAPLTILRIAPAFFALNTPGTDAVSRARVVLGLDAYYLLVSALLVPAFLVLRLLAAHIYASAVAGGVRSGRIPADALAPFEREQLGRLGLLAVVPAPVPPSALHRGIAWAGTTMLSLASIGLLTVVWFSFAAQVFVLEFFNFQPLGWLNQPLLHLPWIRYIPGA